MLSETQMPGESTSNPKLKPGHNKRLIGWLQEAVAATDETGTLEEQIHMLAGQLVRDTATPTDQSRRANLLEAREHLLLLQQHAARMARYTASALGTVEAELHRVEAESLHRESATAAMADGDRGT